MDNILEVKNVSKSFKENEVLRDINFSVEKGEIIGLLGANGSGKSTLLNIIYGNKIIDETGGYKGEIIFSGNSYKYSKNKKNSFNKNIGMIFQEFMVIPEIKIYENIKLTRENVYGRKKNEFSIINKKKDIEDSKTILKTLGIELNPNDFVENISVNGKQFVEIARELDKKDIKLLILDEPTASLNEKDARNLLKVLTSLKESGLSIIFCSHRLNEIKDICDKVIVLRDGILVSKYSKEQLDIQTLAQDMMGYEIISSNKKINTNKRSEVILKYNDFSVLMKGENLSNLNLDVYKGEILGVTSLSGHGKLALGYGTMGLYKTSGNVFYKGSNLNVKDTLSTIKKGIFLLTDDRKNSSLLMNKSIEENITFTSFHIKNRFSKKVMGFNIFDKDKSKDFVIKKIEDLKIKANDKNQKVKELSGGNQQKVCIARALALNPDVLILLEPTRGVDIGSKELIVSKLIEINKEFSTTIIVISSELEELKRISDRILVLCEGKKSMILEPTRTDEEFALALSMVGGIDEN